MGAHGGIWHALTTYCELGCAVTASFSTSPIPVCIYAHVIYIFSNICAWLHYAIYPGWMLLFSQQPCWFLWNYTTWDMECVHEYHSKYRYICLLRTRAWLTLTSEDSDSLAKLQPLHELPSLWCYCPRDYRISRNKNKEVRVQKSPWL